MNARDELEAVVSFAEAANLGKTPAQLLDAHHAEVLHEAADLITSAQEQIERDEITKHAFLDHETVLQRDAVHDMAKLLRTKADGAVS